MKLFLNESPILFDGAMTITQLLKQQKISAERGVALAVNGNVVPKSKWDDFELLDQAEVLLVQATQGG